METFETLCTFLINAQAWSRFSPSTWWQMEKCYMLCVHKWMLCRTYILTKGEIQNAGRWTQQTTWWLHCSYMISVVRRVRHIHQPLLLPRWCCLLRILPMEVGVYIVRIKTARLLIFGICWHVFHILQWWILESDGSSFVSCWHRFPRFMHNNNVHCITNRA